MNQKIQNSTQVSIAPDGKRYEIPIKEQIQASFLELSKTVDDRKQQGMQVVVVQGLGFVGAAVAAVVASARDKQGNPRYFVIGVDLPTVHCYWKVAKINEGGTPVESTDEELDQLIHESVLIRKNLCACAAQEVYSLADAIIVDVHLDVHQRVVNDPGEITIDVEGFERAIRTVGKFMKGDALVLVETTVPAGACEFIARPVLEEERAARNITGDLLLAHAYERVMPGPQYVKSIRNFWRTFSGINEASQARVEEFLHSFIDTKQFPLRKLDSTIGSEMAKLVENSYRAVNIAFIHEWTLLAEAAEINLFEVVNSIRVRKGTHDNMRFPGFGVGGYCLTKDSMLAQWSSNNVFGSNVVLKMTLDALQINFEMPLHARDLLLEMADAGLQQKRILICGVSYLPDVADTRNSPTEVLVDELQAMNVDVMVHDSSVVVWKEKPDMRLERDFLASVEQADGIVFAVPHREYRDISVHELLGRMSKPVFIVDAQNIISDDKAQVLYEGGCQLLGVGKGHWRKRGYQCKKR